MDGYEQKCNENMIIGYKLFNKDFTNRYGMKFEIGQKYIKEGNVRFGVHGSGFHFCKNFEDTFRYFDSSEGFILAQVIGSGDIVEYNDDYYEFYDMYASSELTIIKIISREEIMEMAKDICNIEYKIRRFIQLFHMTDDEEKQLIKVNPSLEDTINLYKSYKKEYILNKKYRKM